MQTYKIVDSRTGRSASLASYLSHESAENAIAAFKRRRDENRSRQDVAEMVDFLVIVEV